MDPKDNMNFGQALKLLKDGKRVARAHWKNVKYIFLVQGSEFEVNRAPLNEYFESGTKVKYGSHIDMCTTLDDFEDQEAIGVWSSSNGDILADDWFEYVE